MDIFARAMGWFVFAAWLFVGYVIYETVTAPPQPSSQCRSVWKHREALREFPTDRDLRDRMLRNAVIERADWCDKHPSGIWF